MAKTSLHKTPYLTKGPYFDQREKTRTKAKLNQRKSKRILPRKPTRTNNRYPIPRNPELQTKKCKNGGKTPNIKTEEETA